MADTRPERPLSVCITFDYDALSLWAGMLASTNPTQVSRGEFLPVASTDSDKNTELGIVFRAFSEVGLGRGRLARGISRERMPRRGSGRVRVRKRSGLARREPRRPERE